MESLLLELPVPFRQIDGVLHVQAQAHNGLARWLDNFDRLAVCASTAPDRMVRRMSDRASQIGADQSGKAEVNHKNI